MARSLYLDLDGAWGQTVPETLGADASILQLHDWGPKLRYHARADDVTALRELLPPDARYVLYGSGDFHHLAGMLLTRLIRPGTILISFDNHPDWDIRPPAWACGGWVHRALRHPQLDRAVVWGCGSFELSTPSRWWASGKALRSGRLQVNAWAERQPPSVQKRFDCMTRENWRVRFERLATSIAGRDVYVTVDLDALRPDEAITNWENGLFTADDIAWAIENLRGNSKLIGADVCGARSEPVYARGLQRFAGNWDHPKISALDASDSLITNLKSLAVIWPALAAQ